MALNAQQPLFSRTTVLRAEQEALLLYCPSYEPHHLHPRSSQKGLIASLSASARLMPISLRI
jgi:hypothetical protein